MMCLIFFQKVIDVLKMDVEGSEWASMEVMLKNRTLNKVKQFVLEIHTFLGRRGKVSKQDYYRYHNILLGLETQGFRRYHNHYNIYGRRVSQITNKNITCCYEIYYININYLVDQTTNLQFFTGDINCILDTDDIGRNVAK